MGLLQQNPAPPLARPAFPALLLLAGLWDAWGRQNEPFTSTAPWMTTVGNHESTPGFLINASGTFPQVRGPIEQGMCVYVGGRGGHAFPWVRPSISCIEGVGACCTAPTTPPPATATAQRFAAFSARYGAAMPQNGDAGFHFSYSFGAVRGGGGRASTSPTPSAP